MKALHSILGLALIGSIFATSCNNSSGNKEADSGKHTIENLTNNVNAEKQTLFLRFVEENKTDSSMIYIGKSLFENDTVGLQIEVLNNIKPGINAEGRPVEEGFFEGVIKLSSIGAESDAFVKALGKMFKISDVTGMTNEVLLPTVFSSNKEVSDLSKSSTYSFKLFFPNSKGEPAEVFASVDTYKKAFQISEKDSTYRAQLLSAFEGK